MTAPAKLIVTGRSLYTGRRTRRALRAALPNAVVRGAGFRGVYVVEEQDDALELARKVQRDCARSIGRAVPVLAEVPSALESLREAAVGIAVEHVGRDESFCFRLHKRGLHRLMQDTPKLEYEIGGAIWLALKERDGKRPRVDLTHPGVTVVAEVLGATTAIGLLRMPSIELRAALFDYGGVLAEEGFREGLYAIARSQGCDPEAVYRLGLAIIYESGYVLGHSCNADFWRLLREKSGIRGADADLNAMVLDRFLLRPGMMAAVRALRSRGLRVAILSDQTDLLDRLEARDHFFSDFDAVFNSYHLGKSKRDPTLFDDAIRALGVGAAKTLFVDDDPGNVERARSRGLRGLVFRDVDQFLAELEEVMGSGRLLEDSFGCEDAGQRGSKRHHSGLSSCSE